MNVTKANDLLSNLLKFISFGIVFADFFFGMNNPGIIVLPNSIAYGERSNKIDDVIGELIKSDGIFLDPVYNAKTFLAMVQYLKNNPHIQKAVYVNTGGFPNLLI